MFLKQQKGISVTPLDLTHSATFNFLVSETYSYMYHVLFRVIEDTGI